MPEREGYRVERLRRRRRGKIERWQAWLLYGLAAVVGFAAVLGAWYAAAHLLGDDDEPAEKGYVALLAIRGSHGGPPVAAALVIKDSSEESYDVRVMPRDLLLEGPNGEYVMAGDALTGGTVKEDLERVIDTSLDAVYTLPGDALARLAGADELRLKLKAPVKLEVAGVEKGYEGRATIPAADIAALMAASGPSGYDASRMQEAIWQAALAAAAQRPREERRRVAREIAGDATGGGTGHLVDALVGLPVSTELIARFPSTARVAEGQFAFIPEPEEVMATITRRAPGYLAEYTVVLRNGSGRVGAAAAVADRLAVLDVNLPAPVNADSFDYRQTQILAGSDAVPIAQEVRAILGHGVVLGGSELPPATVVVIVGSDITASDLESKDKQ